jgi:hypothetical protein
MAYTRESTIVRGPQPRSFSGIISKNSMQCGAPWLWILAHKPAAFQVDTLYCTNMPWLHKQAALDMTGGRVC